MVTVPESCPACGTNVDGLDVNREDPGDALHDHLADRCPELDHLARGDRLLYAFAFGRYESKDGA